MTHQLTTDGVLGTFDAPATGGWDTFTFVPLKTPAGNLSRLHLSDERTLRFTVLPGNLDINYLALIPADANPDITAQSGEQTAFIGESATFTIAATGSGTLTYQWRKNGADLSGENSNTLHIPNVQLSDLGSYTVVVTGDGGSLESEPFNLALPSVSVAATDSSAMELGGNDAYFTISRTGSTSAPLTVNYTVSGTSTMGTDYLPITPANTFPSGQITIPTGQASAILAVKPIDDALVEGSESVILTLNASANYTALTGIATIEILDDEDTSGSLLRELYRDIPGGSIADLVASPKFPNSPDVVDLVSQFESANLGDNYGVRLSGFLTPPVDGDYTFYISGDDNCELWLSTDENPLNKVRIASEPSWSFFRDWVGSSNQQVMDARTAPPASVAAPANISVPIPLSASQSYFVEVIQKEGSGGDQVSVTWQLNCAPSCPSLPANGPTTTIPVNGAGGTPPINGTFLSVRLPMALSAIDPAAGNAVADTDAPLNLTIHGNGFLAGAVVSWQATPTITIPNPLPVELAQTSLSSRQIQVTLPAALIVAGADIRTAVVTVQNPDGKVSNALVFTIGGIAPVTVADSSVVPPGETVVVTTAPDSPEQAGQAGVTAAFENNGGSSTATVTAATYETDPTGGTLFDVGGYVDLQVTGADANDSMAANFFYPKDVTGQAESDLILLYYTGTEWLPVLSSGGSTPAKDTTDDLDGSISGGRFTVVFDDSSTPLITGLSGTMMAFTTPEVAGDTEAPVPPNLAPIIAECSATVPVPIANDAVVGPVKGSTNDPLVYTAPGTFIIHWTFTDGRNVIRQDQTVVVFPMRFQGFHAPIGGADATGGSLGDPLKTFKLGSTIPVKFSAASCDGTPVLTGIHTLTLTKWSSQTDSDPAILVTSTDAATTGNEFRLSGREWHFNIDTKAGALTVGTYELTASLSDGSKHTVWIQLK